MQTDVKLQSIEYTLPAYWASYLINQDASGISDEDKRQADEFLAEKGLPGACSCSDESRFSWRNDATNLGGDVLDFVFLVPARLPVEFAGVVAEPVPVGFREACNCDACQQGDGH